ncbi:ATPase, AAA family domain containing protein [Babesia divergens]|uniref:ATPase, AAA family domain containing protein n=1 Tax=Babesia divergens TaxID=32595 RepID=A0AAD9GH66_BABDI|nr:ATPase, AAA family domain containing protein [Babesia divergens]
MENIAIGLAVAAIREHVPPEYAIKYLNLLLEESKRKNDKAAEWHHDEAIRHTINDMVSQLEEKICPSDDTLVSELQREFAHLTTGSRRYSSIYELPNQDGNSYDKGTKLSRSRAQYLKNFYDGGSYSCGMPLKNAARRYIMSEADGFRRRMNVVTKTGQHHIPRTNSTGSSGVNATIPAKVSPTKVSETKSHSLPSNPIAHGNPPKTVAVVPTDVAQVASAAANSDAVSAPHVKITATPAQTAPKPHPQEGTTRAPKDSYNSNNTVKRHWKTSSAVGDDISDDTNDCPPANNKRPTGGNKQPVGDEKGFKSGMDCLVKRYEEGKVSADVDIGKPKKSLGLSYPSRSSSNNNINYNSGGKDAPSSQPTIPERYIPLISGDVTPELINVVLNMKLDIGLYKITEDDIAGLDSVKKTLKDKVVQPILRPELHTGLLRAPKGVLLFGPPGTGKTTLAKWIANIANANCFEVSPSSITSKFHGESESIIKTLFKVADFDHPSIIFIDEVDAVLGKRSNNEADLSIRMKNQLLQMMDGLHCSSGNRVVIVIAATNRPTQLDDAALRRFGKRVLIPLPDVSTRQRFIYETLCKNCNGKCELSTEELGEIANATEGWNGSDLMALCMKAAEYSYDDTIEAFGGIDKIPDTTAFRGIVMKDFTRALQFVRPSYSTKGDTYFEDWNRQYGSH